MSISVTPGIVFSDSTPVTPANLNALGNPTAAESSGTVTATDVLNYFREPDFNKFALNTDVLSTITKNNKEYISRSWFMRSTGADVTVAGQDVDEETEVNGRGSYALKVTGATNVTRVELGQFIPEAIAQNLVLGNFTVAFYCYNNTGASVTPTCRVSTADTTDDSVNVTFDTVANMTACPDGAWTLCSATIDGTALGANATQGFEIRIRLDSTLNAAGEEWWFAQAQLLTGASPNTSPPRRILHPDIAYCQFFERQNSGTDAGDSAASQSRALNVEYATLNTVSGYARAFGMYATLTGAANGGVLVAPGVYWVNAWATFFASSACRSELNIRQTSQGGTDICFGQPAAAPASVQGVATVSGIIHVTTMDDEVYLSQQVNVTKTTDGLGSAASLGSEHYAMLEMIRLSDPV